MNDGGHTMVNENTNTISKEQEETGLIRVFNRLTIRIEKINKRTYAALGLPWINDYFKKLSSRFT
jgi:hypothetical protein